MIGLGSSLAAEGTQLPGIIVTTNEQSIGAAIDDILLIANCMTGQEIREQFVVFLPLKP
jgi:hypothetical protein